MYCVPGTVLAGASRMNFKKRNSLHKLVLTSWNLHSVYWSLLVTQRLNFNALIHKIRMMAAASHRLSFFSDLDTTFVTLRCKGWSTSIHIDYCYPDLSLGMSPHAEGCAPMPFPRTLCSRVTHLQSVPLPVGERKFAFMGWILSVEVLLEFWPKEMLPVPLALSLCKLCPYSDQGIKVYRKGIILFLNLRS